uniref:Uncharacterized protein n=1 Tax=Arcella intermedia TaxID=1963864 RepID=A0A6B2LNA8_9EUKA
MEDTKRKFAEREARIKAEEQAKRKAEEDKRRAEAESKRKAEEEKRKSEQEAQRKAAEEAKKKVEIEENRKRREEAKRNPQQVKFGQDFLCRGCGTKGNWNSLLKGIYKYGRLSHLSPQAYLLLASGVPVECSGYRKGETVECSNCYQVYFHFN